MEGVEKLLLTVSSSPGHAPPIDSFDSHNSERTGSMSVPATHVTDHQIRTAETIIIEDGTYDPTLKPFREIQRPMRATYGAAIRVPCSLVIDCPPDERAALEDRIAAIWPADSPFPLRLC
jgi:hypothetical protein